MNRRKPEPVRPTQPYPKMLWYQVKSYPPNEEEQGIIYRRHYERLVEMLTKKYPTAPPQDIEESSVEQAKILSEKEINKPTKLERVVVEDAAQYWKTIALIESSENFIQWYEK